MLDRISRKAYYFKVVEAVALRGTCDRGRAGAIIVKNNRILTTGYVGAPAGLPHCDEVGHELFWEMPCFSGEVINARATEHCKRTVHAELNAILQAAKVGVSVDGAIMYCTMYPCYICAQAIVNVGIREVFILYDYQGSNRSAPIFQQAGVQVFLMNEKMLEY